MNWPTPYGINKTECDQQFKQFLEHQSMQSCVLYYTYLLITKKLYIILYRATQHTSRCRQVYIFIYIISHEHTHAHMHTHTSPSVIP